MAEDVRHRYVDTITTERRVADDSREKPVFISPYAHPVVTGSVLVTCEYQGDMYLAICRRGEPVSAAGTPMRLDFPDGTAPEGGADVSTRAAALRSLEALFGLTPVDFPLLNDMQLIAVRDTAMPAGAGRDTRMPRPGFGGNPPFRHVGLDYGAHLGCVKELPTLSGKDIGSGNTDSRPGWIRVRDIELKQDGGRLSFHYRGDNPLVGKDEEIFPDGGMHALEPWVAMVWDMPFRDAGYNGIHGFLKLCPDAQRRVGLKDEESRDLLDEKTQMGDKAAREYERLLDLLDRKQSRTRN